MSGSTRSSRSTGEADGDAAAGESDSPTRSATERTRVDGETPATVEPAFRCLSDIARNPARRPVTTLVAAAVVCALAYQSYVVAVTAGPVVGLLAVAAVVVAHAVARRLRAARHRYMVAELAAADELDRLR
jgi:hypothetical protein